MTYRAPIADIAFTLKHSAGMKRALDEGLYGDLTEADVDAVLEEAGKFASTVIAPLNAVGDRHGTPLKDGKVTKPPGWKEAYTAWAAAGWNELAAPTDFGGQELPHAVNAACVHAHKPLVSGAMGRWAGQVGVFSGRPCYRCLVPDIPPDAETCAAVGVVGALAGVIGAMMALEAIKLITGAGESLTGRLLIYDGLAAETRTVKIGVDPACPVCG